MPVTPARARALALGFEGASERPHFDRTALRTPRKTFATLAASAAAVSTSGDYERSFIADGVRYHHILDPRTGWPSRGAWSATVVSPDATLADALSTALMVLGPEAGLAALSRFPGTEALIVDSSGKVHATEGQPVVVMARPRP